MDDKRLGTALVAIPVLHVLSTSIYLWAFAVAFGGNLTAFFTPTDLFSTSITDMVRVYLNSLVLPFMMGVYRYLPTYKPPTFGDAPPISRRNIKRALVAATFGMIVMVAIVEIMILRQGRPFNFFVLNLGIIVLLAPFVMDFADKLKFGLLGRDIIYIGTLFFISAICLGLDAGKIARRQPYLAMHTGYAMCGNSVVLHKVGDGYLVARPSSRKAIVNSDCKVLFRFPMTDVGV